MKGSMEKSVLLACGFLALLLSQAVHGQYYTPAVVTPPAGNSPNLVVKTYSAYLIYTCVNGAWIRTKGYATLVDTTTNTVVGNYTLTRDNQGELGTWTILNSEGDIAESGYDASIVTGRVIASYSKTWVGRSQEELLQATSHVYSGSVSTVSYIQKFIVSGGIPPPKWECSTKKSVTVPFTGEFALWTQDSLPASVPQNLDVPTGRLLEGFFCQGQITYKYSGGWAEFGREATLYTLPGTPAIGTYTSTNSSESWIIWNPNGVTLHGISSEQVVVAKNGCPWSLSKVTSGWGPMMSIGDFSHVQTTSTRGGVAPTYSAEEGKIHSVQFTAILWFYVAA